MHENEIDNCVCLVFDENNGTFLDSLTLIGRGLHPASFRNGLQHLAVPIRIGCAKTLNKNPVAETVLELKV